MCGQRKSYLRGKWEQGSNSRLINCIHFRTITLGKGMNLYIFIPALDRVTNRFNLALSVPILLNLKVKKRF